MASARHAITTTTALRVLTLPGLTSYAAGLDIQQQVYDAVRAGTCPDSLIQLQHDHVFTIGKRGAAADVHLDEAQLAARGIAVHEVGRGGQVTYHGPGQAVMYPIINLRTHRLGARAYVELLENTMIATLGCMGIAARGQVPGATGVWVGERKIGAIGVQISHGITRHGVALNVDPVLTYYTDIVPCGEATRGVTSIAQLLGDVHCDVATVHALMAKQFAGLLGGNVVLDDRAGSG